MNRIKLLREEYGMTQAELGKLLNVKDAAISKYESEKIPLTAETITKLANIFSVSTDYLLCHTSEREEVLLPIKETYNSIKKCLDSTGYSYKEICNLLDISEFELMDIFCDKTSPPLETLLKISELCETSTDYVMGISQRNREPDLNGIIPFKYNKEIADRIHNLIEYNGYSSPSEYSTISSILSMSDDELFNFITYGFVPHVDVIIKLSTYLGVSADYLLCLSNEKDNNCQKSFRLLNEDNKDIIIGKIKELLKEQRYEESVAADEKERKAVGK